jgi:hypothetical protein
MNILRLLYGNVQLQQLQPGPPTPSLGSDLPARLWFCWLVSETEKDTNILLISRILAMHNGGREFYPYDWAQDLLANAAPFSHR